MKRLTGRNKYGGIISAIENVHISVERVKFMHKLAEYEDTGLDPAQIVYLKKEVSALARESIEREKALAKLEAEAALLGNQ